MKYCAYCGNTLEDDMLFCPKCGRKQAKAEDTGIHHDKQSSASTALPTTNQTQRSKTRNIIVACLIGVGLLAVAIVLMLSLAQHGAKPKQYASELTPTFGPTEEAIVATEMPTSEPTAEPTEKPFTIVGNTEAIEKISRSVVKLTCYDEFGNEYVSGSGFFAFESNLIVTNYHVIEGNVYSITASSDGKKFEVEYLVNYNERYDLALLSVDPAELSHANAEFEPLPIGDSSAVKVSEHITAIGVPLGISKTVSDGMISGFYEDNGVKLIQFTAPISHGSSGGALLNDKGEVIGITSASFSSGQNFNLTVPSSYISILYNANSTKQRISSFHDQFEHYYSVDYCLSNYDVFYGDTIKIYGYVSSFLRIKTKAGQYKFRCYIVPTSISVDGSRFRYIEGIDTFNYSEAEGLAILDRIDKEYDRCFEHKNIYINESTSYQLDDNILFPGNYILITGILSQGTNASYPGKSCLMITPSHIELIP